MAERGFVKIIFILIFANDNSAEEVQIARGVTRQTEMPGRIIMIMIIMVMGIMEMIIMVIIIIMVMMMIMISLVTVALATLQLYQHNSFFSSPKIYVLASHTSKGKYISSSPSSL